MIGWRAESRINIAQFSHEFTEHTCSRPLPAQIDVERASRFPSFGSKSVEHSHYLPIGTVIAAFQAIATLSSLSAAITAAENPLVIDAASAAVAAFGSALTAVIITAFVTVGTIIVLLALASYLCGDVKS